MRRPLRIAMIGQRGVPATVGGVERHVEELGARLAARGHHVTVYCRRNYVDGEAAEHRGMALRHLPAVGTKHLDNIVHSGLSTVAAMAHRPDIVHYHAIGSALVSPLPRFASGARVVLTVHGMDNERQKWGAAAKTVLNLAAWMSARVPDRTITVSAALAGLYRARYGTAAEYIPNGVPPGLRQPPERIGALWGLQPGAYFLFVGRFVPEKAPDMLIRAFRRLDAPIKLVLAGSSAFTDAYSAGLRELASGDARIVFPGPVHGDLLAELYSNALAFVLPSHLEGLPITMLEAASYGTPVIGSDIPPHVEILESSAPGGRLFPRGDEAALLGELERARGSGPAEREGAAAVRASVLARYDWDAVAGRVLSVYESLLPRLRGAEEPAAGRA